MRVVNPSYLLGTGEKILVDEQVVVRQEDTESGMRVIRADDPRLWIFLVFYLVDVFPGILREGNVSASLRRVRAGDARFNDRRVAFFSPDQDAADFCFHRRAPVLSYLARDFSFHQHADRSGGVRSFLHRARSFAARAPRTDAASPSSRYARSLSAFRATNRSNCGRPNSLSLRSPNGSVPL